MLRCYLIANVNRTEPESVRSVTYVHVKARTDGEKTLILTGEVIADKAAVAIDLDTAQAILDKWIADETAAAPDAPQDPIPLSAFIDDAGELKPVVAETAVLDRLRRGYVRPEDLSLRFAEATRGMSKAEYAIFTAQLAKLRRA